MQDWMFFEERQKAKEIISKLNLKEKVALMEELDKDLKNRSEFFAEDIEEIEWNKMIERKKVNERK